MDPHSVHDQRAGGGVKEVVAYAESLARALGFGRIVADSKSGVQRATVCVELDIGL